MNECLFCAIVEGSVKAQIVYQDDQVLAFKDIAPKAPVHILIIPRKHLAGVSNVTDQDRAVIGRIFEIAAQLARQQGIADSGYRIVVNSGADAGQSVLHLHYHLLGGRRMSWPPG